MATHAPSQAFSWSTDIPDLMKRQRAASTQTGVEQTSTLQLQVIPDPGLSESENEMSVTVLPHTAKTCNLLLLTY